MKPREVSDLAHQENKGESNTLRLCRTSVSLEHISTPCFEGNQQSCNLDGASDQVHPNAREFCFSFPATDESADEGTTKDVAEEEAPLDSTRCHAVTTPPDHISQNPFLESPEGIPSGVINLQTPSNPKHPSADRRGANFSLPIGSTRSSIDRPRGPVDPLQETPTRKRVIRPDNWWQNRTLSSSVSAGPKAKQIPILIPGGHFSRGEEAFRIPSWEVTSPAESTVEENQIGLAVSDMDLLHPESAAAMTEHRREAVRLAQAQEAAVVEKCKRAGQDVPAYTFDELIGKGSFGRVYKGHQKSSSKVVAIKVIDIDEADFHAVFEQQDEQINDFNKEIRILKQAQSSGAENLNQMIEALPVHSQLWLICEYCPGGSVKTLMRATNDRLAEQYIVVVARELGKALKGLHQAGIIHRDVKAANVLIHEEGRLQLCDFGVATVLDSRTDKRKTFIGTPHWMPPELFVDKPEYSDEVDVWEFGCTLYECALGKPPNSDLRERVQLGSRMRRLKEPISLPEHEQFSDGLRSLITYTLSPNAKERPSMVDVLKHEYLLDTESTHPTSSLSQLVRVYYSWLYSGGQRVSLFMPGGAVVSDAPGSLTSPPDEWNFSTTDTFEKRISTVVDLPTISEPSNTQTQELDEGEATPKAPKEMRITSPLQEMTNAQKANFEARVKRGADLNNVFDPNKPDYEYKTKTDFRPVVEERRISDLPFRAMAEDRPTSIASNVIDLGDFDSEDYAIAAPKKEEPTIQLADAATIRAKRGDSKGPRDKFTQDTLTAKRTTSAEDLGHGHRSEDFTSAHDFAFPPKEWTMKKHETGEEDEDLAHTIAPRDEGRKTMEWKFPSAAASDVEDDTTESSPTQAERINKHATLDWSFSNAMAEVDTMSDQQEHPVSSTTPSGPDVSRTTPSRPGVSRTMTMPVTSTEMHSAEEHPRPSTSMSSAHSESSVSSADFDPFALDRSHDEYADAIVANLDELGVTSWYASRGTTAVPPQAGRYAAEQVSARAYPNGQPARIGEPGFPGPAAESNPNAKNAKKKKNKSKRKQKAKTTTEAGDEGEEGGAGESSSSTGTGSRPTITMPSPAPPSIAALRADASNEVMEAELTRLLAGLQGALGGASQALSLMREAPGARERAAARGRGRGGRGRGGRPSSSEWEDEE